MGIVVEKKPAEVDLLCQARECQRFRVGANSYRVPRGAESSVFPAP